MVKLPKSVDLLGWADWCYYVTGKERANGLYSKNCSSRHFSWVI